MTKRFIITEKSGFTMVEIMVSTLIFALAIAGLLSTIQSLNRPAVESYEEVQAVYIAKGIAEDLRNSIDAGTWGDTGTDLDLGLHTAPGSTIGGITYTTQYTVSEEFAADGSTPIGRNVDITVTW